MKTSYLPAIVFGVIYGCFLASLVLSAGELPERVATHFNWLGRADGWMTRTTYLVSMAVCGVVQSTFIVGLFFSMRFAPNGAFSLSGRDYWIAPERRAATFSYLLRQSFWLASVMTGFLAGIHGLTIQANRQAGAFARWSTPMAIALGGCVLMGIAVWSVDLIRHFKK